MSDVHSAENDAGVAPCGYAYAEPPDEPIQPGDYHYFNGLSHCACGRWVRPGEHPTPIPPDAAPTVTCDDLGCVNGRTIQGRKYGYDGSREDQWAPCARRADTCPIPPGGGQRS
jgi:hypothetical protein